MAIAAAEAGAVPAHSSQDDLRAAVLRTLTYADVFDFPLTLLEIHRYLVGTKASLPDVDHALRHDPALAEQLEQEAGYFALRGRRETIGRRQERRHQAARLWREARRYGRLLARLPFVRLVAVTGSLASDNVDAGDDVDYFLVARTGRLWLCRALAIGVVHVAKLRGFSLCPNYLVADCALALSEQSLYTARELAHMVPLHGLETYAALRAANLWAADWLPNADGPPRVYSRAETAPLHWPERLLNGRIGDRLESWVMARKLSKLDARRAQNPDVEASFSADICKGHFESHGRRTLNAYERRLQEL